MRYTFHKPRPKDINVSDTDRTEHVFFFDYHSALAASHWQQVVADVYWKLVVMETLKCPLPN